jgi:hypothetical protein
MFRTPLSALVLFVLTSGAAILAACANSDSSSSGDDTNPGNGGAHADGGGTKLPTPEAGGGDDTGTPGDDSPPDTGTPVDAAGNDSGPTSGGGTLPPDAGVTPPTGTATPLLVQVTNSCPVDLWIHGAGQEGVLQPDNAHLVPGATQQYYGPVTWTAARINAFLQAPDGNGNPQGQSDKIEMNFGSSNGSEWINTDITYVDWVALPSKVEAIGSGSDCTIVGCQLRYDEILNGCPPSLLSGHECVSAGSYCLDTTHDSDPFCHALDNQIPACASQYADCAGAKGASTAEVYSCSGAFFSQSPQYCAALNRGVLAQPAASTPPSAFYVGPPFNAYSAWVHKTCPAIYAFPYDDFGSSNQSSDHTCNSAKQLNITFCPKG